MTVERDWFWFWFYYALWLASVFTLVLVLRQSSENRSNADNEETIESVCINGVFVLEGLEKEKCKEFLSPGTKQTVPNKEVSVLSGRP